jgi:hypothetical protein
VLAPNIERLAAARIAIDRAMFVASLLLYIELLMVLILFPEPRVDVPKLGAAALGLSILVAQIVLVRPGLEVLCRRVWHAYAFVGATILLFGLVSAGVLAGSLYQDQPDQEDVRFLPVYFAVLLAIVAYPIVKGLRGLHIIGGEVKRIAGGDTLAGWLFGTRRIRARRGLDRRRIVRALPWFAVALALVGLMFVRIVREVRLPPAAALSLATLCCVRGLRHLSLEAREVRVLDTRPPVLILRAFKDDELKAPGRVFEKLWSKPSMWFRTPSFEELLAQECEPIGPPIIVGAPDERLPRLGAAREHLANEDWQTAVASLIDEALLVVIIVGDTRNLFWELATAVGRRGHQRVLLIVPPVKRARTLRTRLQAFVEGNRVLLGPGFTADVLERTVVAAFCEDDVPMLVGSRKRTAWHYRLALRLFGQLHREGPLTVERLTGHVLLEVLGPQRTG